MESIITKHQLKLPDLNLTQVTMIKIAKRLWKHPDTENQVRELLRPGTFAFHRKVPSEQKKIFSSVFEKIDQLTHLPTAQRRDLKFVVVQIGVSTLRWLANAHDDSKEDLIDNLQWDRAVCVDPVRTYRSLYLSGKITRDTPKRVAQMHEYYLEDCICDFWCKVPADERLAELQRVFAASVNPSMKSYWGSYVSESTGTPVEERHRAMKVTAHGYCSERAPYVNFKYFCEKDDDSPRNSVINSLHYIKYTDMKLEGLETSVDNLNYMMERLTGAKKTDFCRRNSAVLGKIVGDVFLHWPWQDLLTPILQKFRGSISPEICCHMLAQIAELSYTEFQLLGSAPRYNSMSELWEVTSKSVQLVVRSYLASSARQTDGETVRAIEVLKDIFGDEDFPEVRPEFLN